MFILFVKYLPTMTIDHVLEQDMSRLEESSIEQSSYQLLSILGIIFEYWDVYSCNSWLHEYFFCMQWLCCNLIVWWIIL